MKILAYVDQGTGQIVSVSSVSVSAPSHEDGNIVDGFLVKDISFAGNSWSTFGQDHWWDGGEWVSRGPQPTPYHSWTEGRWEFVHGAFVSSVRNIRDQMLAQCDWTQMPDSPLSTDMKNAWATYRQELRDITDSLDGVESLEDVNWPTPPQ